MVFKLACLGGSRTRTQARARALYTCHRCQLNYSHKANTYCQYRGGNWACRPGICQILFTTTMRRDAMRGGQKYFLYIFVFFFLFYIFWTQVNSQRAVEKFKIQNVCVSFIKQKHIGWKKNKGKKNIFSGLLMSPLHQFKWVHVPGLWAGGQAGGSSLGFGYDFCRATLVR